MTFQPRVAAFAALMLIGAGALAQSAPQPPQAPPPPPQLSPAPPVPMDGTQAAPLAVTGRVQQWLVNPGGDVDGLLLADGTQVAFPPHLSGPVLQALKLGDEVQVRGWRAPNVPMVRAVSLTATASQRSVADQPPAPGRQPAPPRDVRALTAMSASGRVVRLLYTGRGDVNGVMLDGGAIVRFPPHVGAQFASTLQPGSTLHAKGWGSRNAQGNALEATALGSTADGLRELFAGPGTEPPPPPGRGADGGPAGPRGPRGPRPDRPLPPPPAS